MDIEKQVCTPAQGERLKALGIKQDSLFYWTHSEKWGIMYRTSIDFSGNPTSVFTVSELGIMLPPWYASWQEGETGEWTCAPPPSENPPTLPIKSHRTEAAARAGLLIQLLENKIVLAETINETLQP
jgi:hypothetical protein